MPSSTGHSEHKNQPCPQSAVDLAGATQPEASVSAFDHLPAAFVPASMLDGVPTLAVIELSSRSTSGSIPAQPQNDQTVLRL
jgi:hypothetical protein